MTISRYQVLLNERAELVAEAAKLLEGEITDEVRARDDLINARVEQLNDDIALLGRQRERERSVASAPTSELPRFERVHDRSIDQPWGYQWQSRGAQPSVVKAAAAGEFLTAVRNAGMGRGIDPRLNYQAAAQSAGEMTPADGGYLVGMEMASDIRLRMMTGQILSRVDSRSLSGPVNSITYNQVDESSRATGSRFGGVQGYWVDEGTAPTASKPTFWKLKLEVHKVMALFVPTDELMSDTVELGRTATTSLSEELRFLAEDRIYNGTGVGSPAGIVGHAATVSVAKESNQAATTFLWENVKKMWARMYAPSRASAVWHINQDVEPALFDLEKVVGTGGLPVFLPPGGASASPFSMLLGRPIIPLEYCPTLGTVGDVSLVDWSEYRYVDKGGIQQDMSIHIYFTTDEMAFRAVYRADGRPKWRTPLIPFKGTANTLSPFVTAATRA